MHAAIILFDFLPHSWPLIMASNDPTTPTANRHHPTGSSTTIPQPDFSATAANWAAQWASLTSTPSSKGIISNQTASTRKQMDPYLNEDLTSSRVYLPFETFLQKVFNLPADWESNSDFMKLLSALEADKAYAKKLDQYLAVCDAAGEEETLYAPAASAYNQATSVLATTASADRSSTLYVYRQDNKRVVGTRVSEAPKFCPDLNGVLHDLWVQSNNVEELVNVAGPEFNFSWEQIVLFLEYKMKMIMDRGIGAPTILDVKGSDPRDPALLKKVLKSARTASGATKRGSDSSKSASKRQKSDPSKTPSRPDIQNSTQAVTSFQQEADDRKSVAYQCANYALHSLSAGGFKDYSLGALICKDQIQLLYYDHSCIAVSAPLDFRINRRMYMLLQVCLFKTQQASIRNGGGIIGRLFLEPSPYMRDYENYQKVVGTDLYNILSGQVITLKGASGPILVKLGRIIDRQAGLIGRCTYIVNAESVHWPGIQLVVKITWSPIDRTSEATFVDRIREAAAAPEAQWVLDHVPNILHSQDFERLPDEVGGGLAAFFNDPATRYADGTRFTYEKRVLRVSVHEKLYKLSELNDVIDYAQVFFDLLQVHRWIYDHARILHRDISLGNIMWHERRGRICGVLNDFDLSSFRENTSPSSKQRTGTRPFMAKEFHVNPSSPPLHLYRHDLESIFYVLFILVVAHKLLDVPQYDSRAEKCYLELNCLSKYGDWLHLEDYQLQTEKTILLGASVPPAPDATFSVLKNRLDALHRALRAGLVARDAHVQSAMEAVAPQRTFVSLRRKPAPSEAARLPPVKEVELQPFDDSTLGNHWTYAEFYKVLSYDADFEEMYPVACPDVLVPYVFSV